VDRVLGLAMTPTTVGLVLVEGEGADGATLDRDAFAVHNGSGVTTGGACERVAEYVARTQAVAALDGHRLSSVAVTWSGDADLDALVLLKSLADSGFGNAVAVGLVAASEAFTRAIGPVIGYEKTAVCVIEPDMVIAMVIDGDGAMKSARHLRITDDRLLWWLAALFDRDDWRPEGVVVVGSDTELDAITARLKDALSVPVLAPAGAQLALARGAALAAQKPAFTAVSGAGAAPESGDTGQRRRRLPTRRRSGQSVAVAAMLAVLVSVVLTGDLWPASAKVRPGPGESPRVANTSGTPQGVQVAPAPVAPPPPDIPVAVAPPPADDPPLQPADSVPVLVAPAAPVTNDVPQGRRTPPQQATPPQQVAAPPQQVAAPPQLPATPPQQVAAPPQQVARPPAAIPAVPVPPQPLPPAAPWTPPDGPPTQDGCVVLCGVTI
jgi:hypothetical protein